MVSSIPLSLFVIHKKKIRQDATVYQILLFHIYM